MKKTHLILSIILTFSLVFSACAPAAPEQGFVEEPSANPQQEENPQPQPLTEDGPITITLWHYYSSGTKDIFDDLISEYNETIGVENGVLIDAYSYSGVAELAEAVYNSANGEIGADDMPGIFASYSDDAFSIDTLGMVAALDSYLTEEEIAEYRAEFLEEGRFDEQGNLKIFPVAKSTEMLYVNETKFNEFSADTGVTQDDLSSWEGLAEVAGKYYEWSDGASFFGVDSMANLFNAGSAQLGTPVFTKLSGENTYTLTQESAKRIWDNIYIPYVKGHYAAVGRFRSDDMKQGYIIAYTGSTSGAGYFPQVVELSQDEQYDITCLAVPYPIFEGAENIMIQQGAGMVVSKSDPVREQAAVDFLKWFTSKEINTRFAVATGYAPVVNSAFNIDNILPNIDGSVPAVLKTSEVLYEIIDEYEFYSPKPFEGSSDARYFIEDSLMLRLEADLAAIQAGDKTQEEVTSEASFNEWYTDFSEELSSMQ